MADTDLAVYTGAAMERAGSLQAIISSDEMERHLAAFIVPEKEINGYKEGVEASRKADKAKYRQETGIVRRVGRQALRIAGKKPYAPSAGTLCLELSVYAAEQLQKCVALYTDFPKLIADMHSRHVKLSAEKVALENQLSGLRDFLSGGAVKTLSLADRLRSYDKLNGAEQAGAASEAAARCGYGIEISDDSVRKAYAETLIAECLAEEQRVKVDFSIAMGNYRSVQRKLQSLEQRGTRLMEKIALGLDDLRAIQERYEDVKTDAGLSFAEVGIAGLAQARAEIDQRARRLQEVQDTEYSAAEGVKQAEDIAACRVSSNIAHLSANDMCAEIDEALGKNVVVTDSETGLEEVVSVGSRK